MQAFSRTRRFTQYAIGGAIVVVAVLGLLFAGTILNPAPTEIVVALVDIPAGSVLTRDMVVTDAVRMHRKVIAGLVLASELGNFVGGIVIEPIHAFQPVPKAAISADRNPAAANRLALALTDPSLVAMVVPVTQATAPDAIVQGDYVDLIFGVSTATNGGARLSTEPTPAPNFDFGVPTVNAPAEASATATSTPEPLLVAPVAKTIVSNAIVLSVVREAPRQTASDAGVAGASSSSSTERGKILALVLAIPREAQELLQFAIDSGTVRVALLSARLDNSLDGSGQHVPSLGMTWNDLISLLRMDREQVLAAQGASAQVNGPGAYDIEATRNAAVQATQQALPTPTATP
jgi:hypothetical protein